MPRKWIVFLLAALAPVMSILPMGCIRPDLGTGMIVSTELLNFGSDKAQLSFQVSKTFSSAALQPVTVVASAPWIVVENCTDPAEQCLSFGPNQDIAINISVLRDRTIFGTNRGQLRIFSGGSASKTVDVVLEDDLQASFVADRRRPLAGQPVQFTDLSLAEGDIVYRLWDFGDGTTSNAINPAHAYAKDGVYSVSLTVATADAQETTTLSSYITVTTPAANVDFVADKTTIPVNELVYFTNLTTSPSSPITGYFWDFGDGGTSTDANPNHQFRTIGPKNITLRVTTAQGAEEVTKTNYILVQSQLAPVAKIAISQLKPYVDIPVQFTDISEVGTSPILSRVWDFGDSTNTTERNPRHTFRVVGTYNVTLTVITEHGTGTATLSVEVTFKPPVAEFAVDNTNPDVFQFIQFTDRSTAGSGPVAFWEWDFGDGKTSTEQNPRHRYTVEGKYSVTLTVRTTMPSNNEATIKKTEYINVIAPPAPAFTVDPRSVFVDEPVTFRNQTIPGTEPIRSYAWDFDGNPETQNDTSTATNPVFTFRTAGTYAVKLTVKTELRTKTLTQNVVVDKAPVADFTASPLTSTTVDAVAFTDATRAGEDGNAKAIVSRLWDFGDGATSTSTNPSHLYTSAGTYTVKLTVNYAHSGTGQTFADVEEKANYITITAPVAPTAKFSLAESCRFTGQSIGFIDESVAGSRPVTGWSWRFGDGATSTQRNPTHAYNAPGTYTVTLTVTSNGLPNGLNTSTTTQDIYITNVQDLDDFVNTPDPAAFYTPVGEPMTIFNGISQIATAHNLYMVSQTWRSAAEIYTGNFDGRVWNHNVTIVRPTTLKSNTGIVLISGGGRFDGQLSESDIEDSGLGLLAAATGCVFSIINNVPAQPIEFADERQGDGTYNQRTEDEILAYSFRKYLDSFNAGNPDVTWPALFPMTKATVRAMDYIQDFMASEEGVQLDDFIITGGSKRGWTTWLTGITDCRIRAIAPLVIDLLNIDQSVSRQLNIYGDFAPTLADYQALGVFDRFVPGPGGNLPADGLSLLSLVDPFEYRQRAIMPKLIVNATGDEFFLPDSSQFYINELKGESRLSYLPNTSHGLTESPDLSDDDNVAFVLTSWILGIVQNVERPNVSWTFVDDNTMDVTLAAPVPAGTTVTLFQAVNPNGRDFRVQTIGRAYRATALRDPENDGTYRAQVATPANGYRAYFVQVKVPSEAEIATPSLSNVPDPKHVFSTPVRVVPNTLPFP